ncbi:MAG TPA: hypothetical protein VNJ54_12615 [Plantibacter sp.]|uniref:hypothetical protein n=1 Tax=Plantibacter sp. TaxID=1871045 RepID=UPI002BD6EB04|nr:hypothetical protein [Plantibacter sp.]
MARQLDPTQLQEFASFLDALRQLGQYKADAEWARESGVHAVNLSNARTGKSQLDGFNLLRLIQATSRRANLEPEQLAMVTARLEAVGDDHTSEIVRRLNELEALVAEGLLRVAEGGSSAASQQPDAATEAQ